MIKPCVRSRGYQAESRIPELINLLLVKVGKGRPIPVCPSAAENSIIIIISNAKIRSAPRRIKLSKMHFQIDYQIEAGIRVVTAQQ